MNKPLPSTLNEWLDESTYQQVVQDMLTTAKRHGATQAQVGVNISTGLNVGVRKQEVETLEFSRDKGIGITVLYGKQQGSASTSDITPESIQEAVKAAIEIAKLTEADEYNGLADANQMAVEFPDLSLYHPWDLSVEEAIETAKICEKSALDYDSRIDNSDGVQVNSSQGFHIYGNSHGFTASGSSSRHSLSCVVIGKDNGAMERDYDYTVARNSHNLVKAELIGKSAAEKTIKRLNAKKIKTQYSPVLFDSNISSGLIGNFMSAISGSRLFRKTSFLLDSLNSQVFPDWITIDERPYIKEALGSASFDADGLQTYDKEFVTKGVVKSYVLGTYSARKLNLKSTANAGGVHNLFVNNTGEDLTGMLKKLGTGVYVTRLMGQGVNLVTGDYSRGASGFWVENGEIKYPVTEFTIAANLSDMFKEIQAIGTDADIRQNIQVGSILVNKMMIAGD
jgi:PmbA protein